MSLFSKNSLKKPPSQQPAKCYYCDTSFTQYKNFKKHHNNKHPGKLIRTKNDAIMDNYLHIQNTHNSNDENSEIILNNDAHVNLIQNLNSETFQVANLVQDTSSTHQELDEVNSEISPIPSHSNAHVVNLNHNSKRKSCNEMEEMLDKKFKTFSSELMSNISTAIATNSASANSSKSSHNNNSKNSVDSQVILCIRNVTTLPLLLNLLPGFQIYYEDECENSPVGIICNICFGKTQSMKYGYFTYDFKTPTDLKKQQSVSFINLKTRIISHLSSTSHVKSTTENNNNNKSAVLVQSRNYLVGLNLVRSAYKAIVTHSSQREYELEITCDEAKGVDVGDKNHSRMFPSDMTINFYKVLQEQMCNVLNTNLLGTEQPPFFAVIADKMTPTRGTLQIVGIITFIEGKIVPLLIDCLMISHHTGEDIAKYIYQSLLKHFTPDQIKTRCVGGAFDGQYYTLNVPQHLTKIMGIPEDAKLWQSWNWDPAHIIELAEKDVRLRLCIWIEQTQKLMSSCNHEVAIGKGYAFLLKKAEEEKMKAHAPISFSKTRFATYSFNSLKNFILNYGIIFEKLGSELQQCRQASFVLRISGMCDVYYVINRMSLQVQQPSILPWHIKHYINSGIKQLNKMIKKLDSICGTNSVVHEEEEEETQNEFSHLLFTIELFESNYDSSSIMKYFEDCCQSLLTKGEFQGKKINVEENRQTRSSSTQDTSSFDSCIKSVSKNLIEFILSFKSSLLKRLAEEEREYSSISEEIFSMKRILRQDKNNFIIPDCFDKYCETSKLVNVIPYQVSLETLRLEYLSFTDVVREKVKSTMEAGFDVKELDLYSELLSVSHYFKDCRNIAHLLLSSCVRTYCEAVAEGMGNVVQMHALKRPQLSKEKLFYEVFLSWNGPPPTRAADKLLEKSLNLKYGPTEKWNFVNSTKRTDLLKNFAVSKVVDRMNKENGKIPF